MPHSTGSRLEQKRRTRAAFLDAGLRLLDEQGLSSLGLREVTRAVGVTPAAFYRHFRDLEEYQVALVEESFRGLHAMVAALREEQADAEEVITGTVRLIARHVRAHRATFRFLTRERHGGVRRVREAIAEQLALFAEQLAGDFAERADLAGWPPADLRMLADLYVDHMVLTVAALTEADEGDVLAERRITGRAERQLRLIAVGSRHWPD